MRCLELAPETSQAHQTRGTMQTYKDDTPELNPTQNSAQGPIRQALLAAMQADSRDPSGGIRS
jgi:hypothetical protein